MAHTALIIDDEADIRELIAMSLDRIGLNTHTACNLEEARNLLAIYQFDVCLTDMRLPDGNGVEFVKYILSVQPDLPIAVITAHGNMDAAVVAMKNGAFDFVSKPVDLGLLRNLVTQAIQIKDASGGITNPDSSEKTHSGTVSTHAPAVASSGKIANVHTQLDVSLNHNAGTGAQPPSIGLTKARNKSTASTKHLPTFPTTSKQESPADDVKYRLASVALASDSPATDHVQLIGHDRLIGKSEPMQALKNMIVKVARTNAPVWITGESGTGKELIAQLIHDNSPRANAPFIAINCGAIPSELMESEMFGHRKGSFTGAHSDHDGLFKRADGGTLFLDEVAELPLHMQVKLLRAIQERKIRPVGSSDEISINARILSASHKDLATEVDEARFRHDLYYRLNVICIRSPSLRHRTDDVVAIARHILRAIANKENMPATTLLTPEAEDALCAYQFPGNVRELENILERAVALSDNDTIEASDLNLQPSNGPSTISVILQGENPAANDIGERDQIIDALTQTRWNRKATASMLGLTYRQLRYRIQQYGIDDDKQTGTQ